MTTTYSASYYRQYLCSVHALLAHVRSASRIRYDFRRRSRRSPSTPVPTMDDAPTARPLPPLGHCGARSQTDRVA
jgi:hypothetical protein